MSKTRRKVRQQIVDENGVVLWYGALVEYAYGDSVKFAVEWPPEITDDSKS